MITPTYQPALCAQIANSLDLRTPNADALTTIAVDAANHFSSPDAGVFEGVVELATGVGKTYVMAAVIDYFAAQGTRNFAIITPGKTVTRKTIANFTPGHRKSLLAGMETTPMVVTSDNFDSPAVAAAIADETIAKLYIFTVQALLTPTSKADRRTHEYQENLGAGFYKRLQEAGDLIVLADEYHLYHSGKKFSGAVRGLQPQMMLGLTATAPKKGPEVLFRYPLAAAIADRYVKSPVLVGRPDDRKDTETKLRDGLRLLKTKATAMATYRAQRPDLPVVNPVMLVLAPDTPAANDCVGILSRPDFAAGEYADAILNIHSNVDDPDAAIAALDAVEDPASKVRVIVSVGMLKEGWDVKNVYVICSLRAMVSEILTEQTLGRGLRLPFSQPTGQEALDTLEVVAHERYDELLKRVEKEKVELIDYRTRIAVASGDTPTPQSEDVFTPVVTTSGEAAMGAIAVTTVAERIDHAETEAAWVAPELRPKVVSPPLMLPVVKTVQVEQVFSLNQIDLRPFREDGESIAATPEDRLRRTGVAATVTTDASGRRIASLRRRRVAEEVSSEGQLIPLNESRRRIAQDVMASGAVASRPGELRRLDEIINTLVEGLGPDAERILSAFAERAAAAIIDRIFDAQQASSPVSRMSDEIEERPFEKVRYGKPVVRDRGEQFRKGDGFTGFTKSMYDQDWFDSESAEFALANLIDDTKEIEYWLRLQIGDLPLPWAGGNYNPDFIVVDKAGEYWVVEGKADRDIDDESVNAKRRAANEWANRVRNGTNKRWHYMFVSEIDIKTAKGSWSSLKQLSLAE